MAKVVGVAIALFLVVAAAAGGATSSAPIWGAPTTRGVLPTDAAEATELLPVDLNGDGLIDAVVGSYIYETVRSVSPVFLINHGNGRFTDETSKLFVGAPPQVEWLRELLTADFNRDGRPDIFIADHGHVYDSDPTAPRYGAQDHLILSTADGHYVDATQNLPQQMTFTHSAAVADVNGDGAPDIFENNLGCCSRSGADAELLLNDGTGHFTIAPGRIHGELLIQPQGQTASYACAFADVNGDGSPDLVIGGSEHVDSSQVLLNDGHGNFTFFETLPPSIGPPQNAFVIDMKAADVNGDGSQDLIFAESLNDPWYVGANVQVLINDGHGHFTDETAARLPDPPKAKSWPDRVLVNDLNDDGRPDLTIQYAPAGVVPQADPTVVYLNENGVFKRVTPPEDGFGDGGGPIAWVNGDGPHALLSVGSEYGGTAAHYFVTPQIVVPAAPRIRAVRIGGVVRITWAPIAMATRYEIRRNSVLIGKTTATSFTDRYPAKGARYVVRSVNAAGASPDSASVRP